MNKKYLPWNIAKALWNRYVTDRKDRRSKSSVPTRIRK